MAYIKLNNESLPGIAGLLDYRKETAIPLCDLAEVLLRGENSLSSGEREIIAASVSHWNDCHYCHSSHAAAAAANLKLDLGFMDEIKAGFPQYTISAKLRALLQIARNVQQGGKAVTATDIAQARAEGATDQEIHDTVLIAAAFCMFNRYVDGLGTWAPEPKEAYAETGERLATQGYRRPR